jgi:hypothetical protein
MTTKTKLPKINFKNRNSRNDKRRKNVFSDDIQGDFDLVMSSVVDNSTGDFNHLWGDFINTLGGPKVMRKQFQAFLQKWLNNFYQDAIDADDNAKLPKEI